ncbi:uncharacterized protein OsI_027940-like [Cucurbita moschata]|uniref:Co-chaperone protein p23 n=1 Tax=Cucurbita moschata TaxID=3662 RepID=A0A6J1H829_CUCMO|nr:uncharacterized protein OsI_027940-like [Cucurbita moschata]
MSRHPEVKWAQRLDKVFITVQLSDSKDSKVNLEPDGVFTFSGSAGSENHHYELKLELFDKVNVEESKVNIGVRSIFCILEKAEKGWWKRLLRGDGKPPHYVKVDWDKWVDEDEDDGTAAGLGDLDLGGMDFSKFGGMGGMDGMGDMGDMGDDNDSDDSDDDELEQEMSNPAKSESAKPEAEVAKEGGVGSSEGKKESAAAAST